MGKFAKLKGGFKVLGKGATATSVVIGAVDGEEPCEVDNAIGHTTCAAENIERVQIGLEVVRQLIVQPLKSHAKTLENIEDAAPSVSKAIKILEKVPTVGSALRRINLDSAADTVGDKAKQVKELAESIDGKFGKVDTLLSISKTLLKGTAVYLHDEKERLEAQAEKTFDDLIERNDAIDVLLEEESTKSTLLEGRIDQSATDLTAKLDGLEQNQQKALESIKRLSDMNAAVSEFADSFADGYGDLPPYVHALGVVAAPLVGIAAVLKAITDPLEPVFDAIDPFLDVLDEAQDAIDTVLAPVIDALLDAFNLNGVLNGIKSAILAKILPVNAFNTELGLLNNDIGFLDDLAKAITDAIGDYTSDVVNDLADANILSLVALGDDDANDLSGKSVIYGGDGDDTITGDEDGHGNTHLFGEGGNDLITGTNKVDFIVGGEGDDTINAGDDDDTLIGRAGNDSLIGGGGADALSGGSGDNTLDGGSGHDELLSEDGNDSLSGGDGNDTLIAGGGDNTLQGGGGNDELSSESGDDSLSGGSGHDRLTAGSGDDTLDGGDGNDELFGGGASDSLTGGDGDDLLIGDGGNDTLSGGLGVDTLEGGEGKDLIVGTLDELKGDTVVGLVKGEFIHILGEVLDGLELTADRDSKPGFVVLGFDKDDDGVEDFNIAVSGDFPAEGRFYINGNEKNNITVIGYAGVPIPPDTPSDDGDEKPEGKIIDGGDLTGGAGDDSISAGDDASVLSGGAGDDTLSGGSESDVAYGGAGDDSIGGGEGDDIIDGGAGDDNLDGGTGNDPVSGGAGNDFVDGGTGDDAVSGGTGDDTVLGGEGDDAVSGGEGADTVDGGTGDDMVDGGSGDDSVSGGSGDDIVMGGAGDDTINGGSGADALFGGEGDDTFVFSQENIVEGSVDTIVDFEAGETISLTGLTNGLTQIGDGEFSGAAGELRKTTDGSNVTVEYDANGDGVADWIMKLTDIDDIDDVNVIG